MSDKLDVLYHQVKQMGFYGILQRRRHEQFCTLLDRMVEMAEWFYDLKSIFVGILEGGSVHVS